MSFVYHGLGTSYPIQREVGVYDQQDLENQSEENFHSSSLCFHNFSSFILAVHTYPQSFHSHDTIAHSIKKKIICYY